MVERFATSSLRPDSRPGAVVWPTAEEAIVFDRLRLLHARILSVSRRVTWLPPLLGRVSVGLVFVTAGWGKLQNLDRVVEFFRSLGIPAPELQAPFVATTELVCGLLLVLGLGTRLAAVPLVVTMVVALRAALWEELEGVIDLFGREEYLFIVVLAWLAVAGAGAISFDAVVARLLQAGRAPGHDAEASPRRAPLRP